MFNSIRKRLIFNFVLIAFIIILFCTGFFTYEMINGIQNQMKSDGIVLAKNIRANIEKEGIENIDKIQYITEDIYGHADGELLYVSVVSKDKTMIAGTIKEGIGKKIDTKEIESAFKSVFEGETVGNIYEWNGNRAYNVSVPFMEGNNVPYSLSVGISIDNMEKTIRDTIIKSIIYAIGLLVLAAVAGIFIGRRIAKPIESINDTLEKISKGDLTVEYKVTGRDEIGRLAEVSNETAKSSRKLFRKIKVISESLSNLSQNIKEGGTTVASASEEIAASVVSVSQEGMKQTEALEESVKLLERFSIDLDEVENELSLLAEVGNTIKEDTNVGAETINKLATTIDDMFNSFVIARNKVENLDKNISQINSIVDVINAVANQTNLLALNASIEAARAGDAGKGFSIVAEEIKKLAEEVLKSSKSITKLVNDVMKETDEVFNTTEAVTKIVEVSKNDIEDVTTSFKGVIEKVNDIPREIDKVNVVLQGTMKGRDEILETVENIASKSQEISALYEEITASTEEQAAITNEFDITSKKLVNIASVLEKNISNYKV